MTLLRVVTKHYVVGLVVVHNRVIEAPPIARWTIGRDQREVTHYFRHRGDKVEVVDEQHA